MRETDVRMAEALGEKSEQYLSLCNKRFSEDVTFAENSEFYQKAMEDGYIFNPYIHRRWLPSQYIRMKHLAGVYGDESLSRAYARWYKKDFIIRYTIDEVYKLAMLQRRSPEAYKERKQFFTIETVKKILLNHIDWCIYHTSDHTSKFVYHPLWSNHYLGNYITRVQSLVQGRGGIVVSVVYSFSPLMRALETTRAKVATADTYFEIKKALDNFPILGGAVVKDYDDAFEEAFLKAGAYYTIKDAIMFRHKKLVDDSGLQLTGVVAFKELRRLLDNGLGASELEAVYDRMEG